MRGRFEGEHVALHDLSICRERKVTHAPSWLTRRPGAGLSARTAIVLKMQSCGMLDFGRLPKYCSVGREAQAVVCAGWSVVFLL